MLNTMINTIAPVQVEVNHYNCNSKEGCFYNKEDNYTPEEKQLAKEHVKNAVLDVINTRLFPNNLK